MLELRKDLKYLIEKYGDLYNYCDNKTILDILKKLLFGELSLSGVLYNMISLYLSDKNIMLDKTDKETIAIARRIDMKLD